VPLTAKQELFCREYLVDLNATQAYIRAGYAAKGARQNAGRLMTNDDVAERLRELMAERSKRVEIEADDILRELKRLALFDIRKAVEWGGDEVRFVPSSVIDDDTAAAIQSIKAKTTRIESEDGPAIERVEMEMKFSNKHAAIRTALEHLGLIGGVDGATPPEPPPKSEFYPKDMSKRRASDE
jgi:phage terminase small subunit